jgi:hypothetical protein
MTAYAMIAKYRGARAVYIRRSDVNGVLSDSKRIADDLDGPLAKKVVAKEGAVLVKSWKDAEAHAAAQLKAAVMTPKQPLVFTNFAAASHRAQTDDGVYLIERWHLNDEGDWEAGRIGHRTTQKWVAWFSNNGQLEEVPWQNPDARPTLDHAKASCQHHANTRLLLK